VILLQNELLEQREVFWMGNCQDFCCRAVTVQSPSSTSSVVWAGLQQDGEEEIPRLLLPLEVRAEICNYTEIILWV